MRRFFVGGNWKSNNTFAQTQSLIKDVINKLTFDGNKVDVVVAPVAIHLPWVKDNVQKLVQVSAQNSSLTKMGAFTGEITAQQLKDFGIPWVILGHSERRTLYGETNNVVAQKVKIALENGLGVIACYGEQLEQRESGKTMSVVNEQLEAIKAQIPSQEQWSRVVLAYEPVWAIGTGKTATPGQAQEVHQYSRDFLQRSVSAAVAQQTRIIYGGSVTEKNAAELITQPDLDGFLVGGASLKPAFADIVAACNQGR